MDTPKRDRARERINRAIDDVGAVRGAIHAMRMRLDPAYVRRYSRYLRGEIDMRDVMQGETHEAWYARQTQED